MYDSQDDEYYRGEGAGKKMGWYEKNFIHKETKDERRERKRQERLFEVEQMDWGREGNYRYDFGQDVGFGKQKFNPLTGTPIKETTDWWKGEWSAYETTGNWKGYDYYKKSTIDYRYVEQMANTLSSQHNIKVISGDHWQMDLEKKELTYDPVSLMFGTKANVIATILHEVGHLAYTTGGDSLSSPFLDKYPKSAFEVLNFFEDFRIDNLMLASYGGNKEVKKANDDLRLEVIQGYQKRAIGVHNSIDIFERIGKFINGWKTFLLKDNGKYNEETQNIRYRFLSDTMDGDGSTISYDGLYELSSNIENKYIKEGYSEALRLITLMDDFYKKMKPENFIDSTDYLMSLMASNDGIKIVNEIEGIKELVSKTKNSIQDTLKEPSTVSLLKMLDEKVYPIIEKILESSEQIKDRDGMTNMSNVSIRKAIELARGIGLDELADKLQAFLDLIAIGDRNCNKNPRTRIENDGFGAGSKRDDYIPKEWYEGDYNSLRDSVDGSIQNLVKVFRSIKVKDNVRQWEFGKKRGKINIKQIYKYPSQRYDFFKKRRIVEDRVNELSFSVIVDESGSMSGKLKSINATRATILLAETMYKMSVPYEILTFGSSSRVIKDINSVKPPVKYGKEIGSIVSATGSATLLNTALEKSKLTETDGKNKVMVVLTDGDDGRITDTKKEIKNIIEKIRVKNNKMSVLLIIINDSNEIKHKTNMEIALSEAVKRLKVVRITDACKIPELFADFAKEIVQK